MNAFDRLAPYIQDYIYAERWDELREVQVAACDIIFNTDNNLLLSTGTASGKTEAAFLPTLTKLHENPSKSVGILYIGPLKALINDQFYRLDYLLKEGNIPVCKWHGDAPQSAKKKLLKNPQGIVQITPESLESLLINKQTICLELFKDLRFIIIDEIHYFMSSPRGIQLLCQLERIQNLTKVIPRRIGLSATLGDYTIAETWLNGGTNRKCSTPIVNGGKRKISIAMERFTKKQNGADNEIDTGEKEHFEYLYKKTLNKKSIIFANSRSIVEFAISNIKKIADENHTRDVYRVHHGNISAILREETEKEMKISDESIVTGATVTLELGMDIGTLDRIAQIGAPFSVSSFTQRLGRCGRRGQSAELLFTFIEDTVNLADLFTEMNWEFLRGIAILQLYLTEKWIEPIALPRFPFAMLYHQTMAYLASRGETHAAALAQNTLSLSPFKNIPQNDYKRLLRHLIAAEQLQQTERGGLIIGRMGEKIISHYEFYSVFETPTEYLVKCENTEIGTIQQIIPLGEHFALAGRTWECIDIKEKSKTIFVKQIKGVSKIAWINSHNIEFHTKLLQKMHEILLSNENYAYLSEKCIEKLTNMRNFAQKSGFATNTITAISNNQYAIFPWIGTKQMCALKFSLENKGFTVQERHCYLIVKTTDGIVALKNAISDILTNIPDKHTFALPSTIQIPYKYNNFIPDELLEKQFIEDYIDLDGMANDFQMKRN